MVGVLSLLRGWSALRTLATRGWLMTSSAAVLIAVNVVEAALGYFVIPLVSVLLGWWSRGNGYAAPSASRWCRRRPRSW